MYEMREETEQSVNRKKLEDLHYKYINLAKEAQKREDRVLSESYYQRAEYYLHAINELSDSTSIPVARSSVRRSSPVKKVIEDFNLKKTSHEKFPSKQPNAHIEESDLPQEAIILPFKGSFLRRNRREVQHKVIRD